MAYPGALITTMYSRVPRTFCEEDKWPHNFVILNNSMMMLAFYGYTKKQLHVLLWLLLIASFTTRVGDEGG